MKKIYTVLVALALIACDDGNIDVPEFDFEGTITNCGELVLYKVNGSEALSLELSKTEDFLTTGPASEEIQLTESGSNTIVYRTFDAGITGGNYFCQDVPSTEPNVLNEWKGSGNLVVNVELTLDDQDTVEEDIDSATDTDEDGFLDYFDFDDDGDGVLTKDEDVDGDGNPTNDDTDGDGVWNYLDADDDNDTVPTRNEPGDANDDGIPDYLDASTNTPQTPTPPFLHVYVEVYESIFIINNLNLVNSNGNEIRRDLFEFGSITKENSIETDTPPN